MMHRNDNDAVRAKPADSDELLMTTFQNLDPSERQQLIFRLMAADFTMLAPQDGANPDEVVKMMTEGVQWRNKIEFLKQLGQRSEIINRYCLSSDSGRKVSVGQKIKM